MERQVEIKRVSPRAARDPRNEATFVLAALSSMFDEMLPGFPDEVFGTYILKPAFEATFPAGDTLLTSIESDLDAAEPGVVDPINGLRLFSLGACYAADAVKAMNIKNPQLAWTMICDAHYYRGLIMEMLCSGIAAGQNAEASAGTLSKILEGASAGGKKSAQVRQASKKVPDGDALRAERDKLVAGGVPSRGVAGLLAMRYACTATHIRNLLNRN
jgi:hypothetical protein